MTDFSPAAQAVKDAALAMYADCNVRKLAWPLDMPVVAAALRSAADQVVPEDLRECETYTNEAIRLNLQGIRCRIFAIAAELEALPND